MRTLTLAAIGAVVALAGCQSSTGISTYGGSIDRDGQYKRTQATTVRKKVGKVRKVDAQGNVYYVNKYVRVKRGAAKRVVKAKSAYAPKQRKSASKVTKAIAKVSKRSVAKRSASKKVRHNKRGSKNIDALIAKHARANGVPLKLARAVVKIESGGRVNATGAAGEVGLMQLMPHTARGIGYKGKMKNLYNPDTNLAYGMKYLGKAYKLGGKTPCGAVLKYNAGHYAKRWNPISRKYCKRVKKIMKKG